MRCPSCNIELQATDKSGISGNHCPRCRGVWLESRDVEALVEHKVRQPLLFQGSSQGLGYPTCPPPTYRLFDIDDDHFGDE